MCVRLHKVCYLPRNVLPILEDDAGSKTDTRKYRASKPHPIVLVMKTVKSFSGDALGGQGRGQVKWS